MCVLRNCIIPLSMWVVSCINPPRPYVSNNLCPYSVDVSLPRASFSSWTTSSPSTPSHLNPLNIFFFHNSHHHFHFSYFVPFFPDFSSLLLFCSLKIINRRMYALFQSQINIILFSQNRHKKIPKFRIRVEINRIQIRPSKTNRSRILTDKKQYTFFSLSIFIDKNYQRRYTYSNNSNSINFTSPWVFFVYLKVISYWIRVFGTHPEMTTLAKYICRILYFEKSLP